MAINEAKKNKAVTLEGLEEFKNKLTLNDATTHLYAGEGKAANAATENGNTKITVTDNTTVRNSISLVGSGSTTVTSDDAGNITVDTPLPSKLATGAKINGINFDGSSDIEVLNPSISVGSDAADAEGWYKFASFTVNNFIDVCATLTVTSEYERGNGILSLHFRGIKSDTAPVLAIQFGWLVRSNFDVKDICYTMSDTTVDCYVKVRKQYHFVNISVMQNSTRKGMNGPFKLVKQADIKAGSLTPSGYAADIGTSGNADTINGLSSTSFLYSEAVVALKTDINECFTPGTYAVSTVYTPNIPTGAGDWGILDVRKYGSTVTQKIEFTDTNLILNRHKIINQQAWSEWKAVTPQYANGWINTTTMVLGWTPTMALAVNQTGALTYILSPIENGISAPWASADNPLYFWAWG